MHRLYLLRHASAGWAGPGMRDFDRPLTEKGRADASAMGALMRQRQYVPQVVLCSPAARTRETWACLASGLGIGEGAGVRFVVSEALYSGDAAAHIELVTSTPASGSILLVGHNPMMAELGASLPGDGERAALRAVTAGFPKGALAVLTNRQPLASLRPGGAHLEAFLTP